MINAEREVKSMIEMLKSKTIIAFVILVLGVTFFSASPEVKLEETNQNDYMTMNIQ